MATEAGYLGKVTIATDKVAELGTWNIAGQAIELVEDSQFGDTFKSWKASVGDGGTVTFSGHYDPDDANGQTALQTLYNTKAETNELRLYFGDGFADFFYCKGDVTCYVSAVSDLGVDQNGLGTIEFTLKVSEGFLRKADACYDATAVYHCSINAVAKTFTKIGGGGTFAALGFVAAQQITVRGFAVATNNVEYTIDAGGVADNVLTTTVQPAGGDEGNITTVRIIGKTV